MTDRFTCAQASLDCDEPLYGTASLVRRWILIEQPGPWGPDAVSDSRLPAAVGGPLQLIAGQTGARLLLIRRHGRYEPVGRTCLVVVSTPRVRHVERLVVDDPTDLLDLDWAPLADDRVVGGEVVADPVFLVCTNGRHDPCCAERGRPLAHALTTAYEDQVWESSHFGGDRFAGNLVCLPHGLYYGRVDAADGPRLAALYTDGKLDLEHFRGRSGEPFAVQAAEYFLRRREGLVGVEEVVARDAKGLGADRVRVRFTTPGGVVPVTVQIERGAEQQLTCRSATLGHPPRYREVAG